MSHSPDRPGISVRLSLGPFELVISNVSRDELSSTLEVAIEALDSNVEKIRSLMEKTGTLQASVGVVSRGHQTGDTAGLSLPEFVKKTNKKKDTDIALGVAYYLFKVRGLTVISARDLSSAYNEARLPSLTNVNATLNSLVANGRMMEAAQKDDLKGFSITQTGEGEVEGWLFPKS